MKRDLYHNDHEDFRSMVRDFAQREVAPHVERWEDERQVDRGLWRTAGQLGIVGLAAPEEYGGGGMLRDYRYRNIVMEELSGVFANSVAAGFSLQDDVAIPYFVELSTDEQKQRWLPGLATGELIAAVAMTEPGAGSDLRGIRTSGTKVDGGWILNGSKTFITNGIHADVVAVVVRTDPSGGSAGFTLMVVERGMKGFRRGRKLAKMGLHAQDTGELFFDDVFVPDENVLGVIGGGLAQLHSLLPLERLSIAAAAVAMGEAVFGETVSYVRNRTAFGKRISDFQNSQFEIAEIRTELDVARTFVDRCILIYGQGDLTDVDAAKAKWWASDMVNRLVDRCVQLHGGYGFMIEYPVARAYQDARIQRIFGGTNEIMKHIIARDLLST